MISFRIRLATLSLLLLGTPTGAQSPSVFPSKEQLKLRRLLDEAHVPAKSRTYLRSKMKKHSQQMRDLVMKVALLEYEGAKNDAVSIANEPRLDRTAAEAAGLSDSFFRLQDTLKTRAEELAAVADKREPEALASSLATLLQTCVSCHAVFRHAAATPPDAGPAK